MIDPSASHHLVSRWKLGLADRWYLIQSETLHIPDRFGFFTPGPPPHQEFEVERFIGLLSCQLCLVLLHLLIFSVSLQTGVSLSDVSGILLGLQFAVFGLFWGIKYPHPSSSTKAWGTWEYSDDDAARIHYCKELFELCVGEWNYKTLLRLLVSWFLYSVLMWIEWPWL
ncbi:unnamed protein product [Fusarium venenatum]|uniref:Uncharacterized protein n=1 Tax=Fusarium venenatum TaxID=56646 RepID=A0A2L2SSP8_9HYPO|nr:uncharacterized protein FVRRES_04638 [Fusarium venenatum]KAH6991795.1 hypothetical protein EDB82DRAFT_494515 [Fusarium venenatum]CEI60202.1 unnamed protein product [Fusarium venenatum]